MMPIDQLIALTTLALVGSFTPGPNTTIAAVTGANHGLRATLPHVFGVPLGFGSMLVAGSLGIAALLLAHPLLPQLIRWAGAAYLLWIAWRIASAGATGSQTVARPLTFWQSAAFQYANPKAWMLAAATAGTFMSGENSVQRTALICAIFMAAALGSLVLWAVLGAGLRNWLAHGKRLRIFNLVMGILLGLTAIWMVGAR